MLVSREWLNEYVSLPKDMTSVVDRLTMSGLNHEESEMVDGDEKIDLEVTSNRSDCLGHIGIAREISVLLNLPLTVPQPMPVAKGASLNDVFGVSIECPDLCRRFTARLVRGVKVGPSPDWLVRRLATIGIAAVNNIVDVTNYVMFECGQPLHAFDFSLLSGKQIIVREPLPGEKLTAINHVTYELEPGMCVIADGQGAVGLGGVMGGAETEVTDVTRNILIEAAWFSPKCIRSTARKLNLHSAASFRFERTLDAHQIDWASRRCCELILKVAGGELADGVIDVGERPNAAEPFDFRTQRIDQVLGIPIARETTSQILNALGFELNQGKNSGEFTVRAPSWRQDVTREIDLVEEVGRIYGYENVPDNVAVPMSSSVRSHVDRVVNKIRGAMSSMGLDEAMTASLVPEKWSETFSPWCDRAPLQSSQPMLGVLEKASQNLGAVNLLRRSLVPSLLEVFRINEYKQNSCIDLFEISRTYLPTADGLPEEPWKLGVVCEFDFVRLKGVIESLVLTLAPETIIDALPCDHAILDMTHSAELKIAGKTLGWLGEVSSSGKSTFAIRRSVSVAEIDIAMLVDVAHPVALHTEVSPFPSVSRDFNFVVDEQVRWSDIAASVRSAAGPYLESVTYKETFRDPQRDGADKKRLLLSVVLRSGNETLTREQADEACQASHTTMRCRSWRGIACLIETEELNRGRAVNNDFVSLCFQLTIAAC